MTKEEIIQMVEGALEKAAIRIKENIHREGVSASGRTADSLMVERTTNGAKLTGRSYFSVTERGRAPGKVLRDMQSVIMQWLIDKGVSVTQIPYKRQPSSTWQPKYSVAERSLRLAAGAITYAIKKKGTKLYQQGGKDVIYTPVVNDTVNELTSQLADLIIKETLNSKAWE